jgi:hypothetical protein
MSELDVLPTSYLFIGIFVLVEKSNLAVDVEVGIDAALASSPSRPTLNF